MFKSNGSRPQGGWKGGKGRPFGGGFRRDDRGFDRPQLHQATCATCGDGCEVPFKPNGSRPIYCRACFKKDGDAGNQPMRFDREEKRMYDAECATCGDECQVPFRPTGERPVYCRDCFGDAKSGATDTTEFKRAAPVEDRSKEQFAAINAKLDMILKALDLSAPAKTAAAPKAEKAEVTEKPARASKAPAKKAAAKKKK